MKTNVLKGALLLSAVIFFCVAGWARDLKSGMNGDDVRQWQIFLIARDFHLPTDGYYGPVTRRATRIFQKKWKLYIDGVVGKQTMRKARSLGYDGIVRMGSFSSVGSKRLSDLTLRANAMRYLQNYLHDPYSAEIVWWGTARHYTNGDYSLSARIRAKNRLGAYAVEDSIFIFDKSGTVTHCETD